MTGLEPSKTYEWQILTRDGDLRTAGQFQSAAAGGTAPDVNANAGNAPAYPTSPAPGASNDGKVPLYRSANSTGNLHLYTTNAGTRMPTGSMLKAQPDTCSRARAQARPHSTA